MDRPEPVVLEGHGVRLEPLGHRHVPDLLRADGTVRDSAYFSVLLDEWPGVRTGLDSRLSRAAPEATTR